MSAAGSKINRNVNWIVDKFGTLIGYRRGHQDDVYLPALATDSTGSKILVGPDSGIIPTLGNVITVGAGGRYSTLAAAISAIAPTPYALMVARITKTEIITATNGSAVVTGSGTTWLPGSTPADTYPNPTIPGFEGDWWKPNGATRYYRIKSIDSNTQLTLHEPYLDTTISAVSTTYSSYYLNRTTLLMLPGHHQCPGIDLAMGIDITGVSASSVILDEPPGVATWTTPFGWLYDANISNITISPSNFWGDMDGIFGGGPSGTDTGSPAGIDNSWNNVTVICANLGQNHSGGALGLPVAAGGRTTHRNCDFRSAKAPTIVSYGRVTSTVSNTRLRLIDCTIEPVRDPDHSTANMIIDPGVLTLAQTLTLDIINCSAESSGINIDALSGNVGSIKMTSAGVVNLHSWRQVISNANAAQAVTGIQNTSTGTFNLFGCNIKTSAAGISNGIVNSGGGVVNIDQSNIEGSTYSINNISGTVNIGKGVTLTGPIGGVLSSTVRGVATLMAGTVTVNTSMVHANSRVKLCHQTVGGAVGVLTLGTVTAGTSFVINSSSGTDTSVVLWELEH